MGMAVILECMLIMHWLEEEQGLGPVGLTGFSLGGHVCNLVNSNSVKRRSVLQEHNPSLYCTLLPISAQVAVNEYVLLSLP